MAVQTKADLWVGHTTQDAKLAMLDQKAGNLLDKINRHPQNLQRCDEAIEAAREAVDKKIQERLDYADKLREWQTSLGDAKGEIANYKTDLQAKTVEAAAPQPTQPQVSADR